MTPSSTARYAEFTGKPHEMAMLCGVLRDRGRHGDALAMGEAAIAAAPDDLAVRSAVRAALARDIAGYHYPMLLDRERNAAYADAIAQAVRPGMLVLEIGSGAGLLALLAARAGAQVVTCEETPMMAAAARAIVERNGLSDRISVIGKRSDALRIPEDLPRQADLIVHEIFGSQLVDEGVVASLADARKRLLRPDAPSVPARACVRAALVASASPPVADPLADVHGFDLSPFELLIRPVTPIRPNARRMPELRSRAVSALPLDFHTPAPFGPVAETVAMESFGGRIDGVGQWIEIGFDGGTRIDNDPFRDGPASSWAAMYQPLVRPIETVAGDMIDVTFRSRGPLLLIDAVKRESARSGG